MPTKHDHLETAMILAAMATILVAIAVLTH